MRVVEGGGSSWLCLVPGGEPAGLPGPFTGPLVVPQALAALEREHREELERLSASLEAKHGEVRRAARR